MLLFRCLFGVFWIFFGSNGWAAIHVTSGNFVYQVESSAETLSYQVQSERFHGVAAWHMHWHSSQLDADHYIRRDNGAPLYIHRVLYDLQKVIEIDYAQSEDTATVYRLYSHGELQLTKRIDGHALIDFATLPQLLREQSVLRHSIEVINYADGKIYPLKVSLLGKSQFTMHHQQVAAMRYRIEVDSWLSMFGQSVQVDIPVDRRLADIATYSGPDFMGNRRTLILHLL